MTINISATNCKSIPFGAAGRIRVGTGLKQSSEELGVRQSPEKKIQNGIQCSGSTHLLANHTAMQCLLDVTGLNPALRRPKQS